MTLGTISKMKATWNNPVDYALPLGNDLVPLNPYLGRTLRIEFAGRINCTACGRKIKKSYQQGYCYPCTQTLAECDICIVRPERCHYDDKTCREPDWGERHCLQPHIIYLANSSGLKVGITRATQLPTRWIDQGATQALPIFRVQSRLQSGLLEVAIAEHVADKTDWRKMLKGEASPMDLVAERERLLTLAAEPIAKLQARYGLEAIAPAEESKVTHITFPVGAYPDKVTSLNLDKTPLIEGTLRGIKGQYLIFDHGVINVRKYTGYQVTVSG